MNALQNSISLMSIFIVCGKVYIERKYNDGDEVIGLQCDQRMNMLKTNGTCECLDKKTFLSRDNREFTCVNEKEMQQLSGKYSKFLSRGSCSTEPF